MTISLNGHQLSPTENLHLKRKDPFFIKLVVQRAPADPHLLPGPRNKYISSWRDQGMADRRGRWRCGIRNAYVELSTFGV
jgi:hypothetical protein